MTGTKEGPDRPGRKPQKISPDVREEILRLAPNYGAREIAKRVALSRKLVRKILEEVRPATEKQPLRLLDPFRERIRLLVQDGRAASRILREIRGEDEAKAEKKALKACGEYAKDCQIVRWVCTTR